MKENLYDELYTEQEEQVDYKALFFKYLIHWKWFVASIVVCLIGGWIYLHYTTPVYSITGSVIIKDNKKNSSAGTGLGDLEDLGFYSSTSNFDNEVEVLHSRTLLKKVVEELDLYINYRTRENLRPVELYKDTPVKVWLTPEEAEKLPNGAAVLEVVLKPGGKLSVSTEIDEQEFKQDFDKLPALLTTPYGTFSFTPGDSAIVEKEQEIEHLSYLLDPNQNKIQIDILFCIATEKARTNIKNNLDDYLKSVNWQNKVEFNIHIVQLLEDKLSNDIKNNKDLVEVLKKDEHFVEECVISKSYKVGKNDNPWLGFDECALPVVLAHNTPNNSLPIIWQNAERFHGLFPRISRH